MIKMRKGLLAFTFVALICSTFVSAGGFDYHTAVSGDYGTYIYFSTLLNESHSVLGAVLTDQNSSLELALNLSQIANSTYQVLVLYSSLGVSETPREIAPYFVKLEYGVYLVAAGDSAFREAFSIGDFGASKNAVLMMESGVERISSALSAISSVRLRSEKGGELSFDTTSLEEDLRALESLVRHYNSLLAGLERPHNFTLFVTDSSPFAEENVTFYGFAPGLSGVEVVIGGEALPVNLSNGSFSTVYSFREPGTYEVYARALNGSIEVISNELVVNISRIPTTLVATENVSMNPSVNGYLLDYFGRPVSGANVTLLFDGRPLVATTDESGAFTIPLPNFTEETNVTLTFAGSKRYLNASLPMTLLPPLRKPIIRLYSPGSVSAGTVRIRGEVLGPRTITLVIYVDGKQSTTITARGNFTFSVKLSPGVHEVYAYFPGNGELPPSKSNVLRLEVSPVNYVGRAAAFLSIVSLLVLAYAISKRKKPRPSVKKLVPRVESSLRRIVDFREAYRIAYDFLRRFRGLPPSTTPRELLGAFRGTPAEEHLKELTTTHERAVYAGKKLSLKALRDAVGKASHAIIGAIVGDEL